MNDERKMGRESVAQTRSQEAEQCFHKAIDVARQQEAKSLELRAATSLARLWHQQGKAEDIRIFSCSMNPRRKIPGHRFR